MCRFRIRARQAHSFLRAFDGQRPLHRNRMESQHVDSACFYRRRGKMTFRSGQIETVAPFKCIQPRTKMDRLTCTTCGRHFHLACDERMRAEFIGTDGSQEQTVEHTDRSLIRMTQDVDGAIENPVSDTCMAVCFPCKDPINIK